MSKKDTFSSIIYIYLLNQRRKKNYCWTAQQREREREKRNKENKLPKRHWRKMWFNIICNSYKSVNYCWTLSLYLLWSVSDGIIISFFFLLIISFKYVNFCFSKKRTKSMRRIINIILSFREFIIGNLHKNPYFIMSFIWG